MRKEPEPLLYLLLFAEGVIFFQIYRFLPLTISIVFLAQVVITGRVFKRPAVLTLILIAGFLYASLFIQEANTSKPPVVSGTQYPVEMLTNGLPVSSERGFLQPVKLLYPRIPPADCYLITERPVGPSKIVFAQANLFLTSRRMGPGVFFKKQNTLFINARAYSVRPINVGLTAFSDNLRWQLYKKFHGCFPRQVAMLLDAIVIGHRDSSDADLYRAFSRAGLSHLMSISGTHFGLFAFIVFSLIRQLARLLPYRTLIRLTARYSLQEYAAVITVCLVSFYLLLSGGRIPAIRAFIMIMLFLSGLLWGRDTGWKYALSLAAVIILIINIDAFLRPSFQLSFMAVWFIGSVFEYIESVDWIRTQPKWKKTLIKLFLVPAIAFAGTTALTAYYFHRIPLLSIPLNMIITPVVCFLLIPISLLSSILYIFTGIMPFKGLIVSVAELIIRVVYLFSSLKDTVLPVRAFPLAVLIGFYLSLISLVLKRFKLSAAGLALLSLSILLSASFYNFRRPMVTFIDVGQGDSSVVETSDNHTLVFDTGNTGRMTGAYLKYMGKARVDAVVLSHAGHDHSGGLYRILKEFTVKELWDNGEIIYGWLPEKIKHRRLQKGYVLKTKEALFTVLHPYRGYYNLTGADDNNHCLVIRYAEGSLSVLFTGDIEKDAEAALSGSGRQLRSTVLKVAHHGSHTSSTKGFLSLVSPQIAVISVGAHNSYGHPHPDVLKRLSVFKLFRTDRDGAIRVYQKRDGTIGIARYRDMLFEECLKAYSIKAELQNLKRLFLVW